MVKEHSLYNFSAFKFVKVHCLASIWSLSFFGLLLGLCCDHAGFLFAASWGSSLAAVHGFPFCWLLCAVGTGFVVAARGLLSEGSGVVVRGISEPEMELMSAALQGGFSNHLDHLEAQHVPM